MTVFETDATYVASTYARFPLNIVKGKGALAWDEQGKEYIDMGSGIAVNSFGYCDDEWVKAVTEQLNTVQHTSNLYYTSPCATLAKLLCERTGMKKVFFANSGAEANECAIKTARKYAADAKGADYYTIITLNNSFHGRTITTLAATGQDSFHQHFLPLTEGFVHCDPTTESLKTALQQNKVAAIMFEVIRGEGGVLPLDADFVSDMVALAAEHNVLLIADEVQTGNGRTGKLYGYMHYGFTPDIVTTAKGLGGGLPIGATLFSEKTQNVLTAGLHGSTFGGNPVACAGAVNVLQRIDDEFLEAVHQKSEYIIHELKDAKGIKAITGMGLMLGIQTEKPAKEIVALCREQGVLVLTAKDKVRLLPPLNIPQDLLARAVAILKTVCAEGLA